MSLSLWIEGLMKNGRDIDVITAAIKERIPDVQIEQWVKMDPTDDDGLWYFRRGDVKGEIQLESSSGNCPFVIESDAMKSSAQAVTAPTPDEAVKLVTEYLGSLK
jgi:hypothetical protein